MTTIETALITGANAGLGKDAARQLALLPETRKIYIGARNEERAVQAKQELEEATGRSIFEVLLFDVGDLDSVREAAAALPEPVDALVMNAGGPGGKTAVRTTDDGVLEIFAVNLLGHVVLADELLRQGKLRKVAVYAGSEAARGIPSMRMARPDLETSSVEEFASIADGSWFDKLDPMVIYGPVKYMAALWMSSMARRHPDVRFVTVSPGATSGTSAADKLPAFQRFFFTRVAYPLLGLFGRAHGLEAGAKRYVDVITDDQTFETGRFYASAWPTTSGNLVDQAPIFDAFDNERFQDNAYEAIHKFVAA